MVEILMCGEENIFKPVDHFDQEDDDEEQQQQQENHEKVVLGRTGPNYSINDNVDILAEIFGRLDGRSLASASGVCRLWYSICRRDAVWESACRRHAFCSQASSAASAAATRAVVAALGGWHRLYRLCLGPALDRLSSNGTNQVQLSLAGNVDEAHLSLSLSLSLFSIDCYERLGSPHRTTTSLLFLSSNAVNVS